MRGWRGIAAAALVVVLSGGGAWAQGLRPDQLPRGDYETYWRQIGGNWLSGLSKTTIQGCEPPASTCGAIGGGPRLAGQTVSLRANGCGAPAITVQCVVQKAGLGLPGKAAAGGSARPTSPPPGRRPGLVPPEQLPRGDYETYWRQIGGNWLSGLSKTKIQGCAPPPSACGAIGGGLRLAGETVKHRANGCGAPPITVQCVVQKAGMGLPSPRR